MNFEKKAARHRAAERTCAWMARVGVLLASLSSPGYAQVLVGDSGTPNYSQALAVPPGVAGMAPKLSLFYAGGGVNGPLGHGWSLQGLSAITRCPPSAAVDGKSGGVTYGANDKLCLDGQRLIQTDAGGAALAFPQTNDAAGLAGGGTREYRTEKEIYARIRAYGYANGDSSGASGPAYFRVWTKAGQIYDYGASPSADANTQALIAVAGKPPMAWAVARISDTLGNFIDFKYEQRDVAWGSGPTAGSPAQGHEWNILEIQYSGNKVRFNYDVDANGNDLRPDKAEAYQLGNKNVSVRRLKSITTYVNSPAPALGINGGTAVKTVQLDYETGTISGRSRINRIRECAGAPTSTRCLPATTLQYANGGSEAYTANASFANSPLASLNLIGERGALPADFNGDGKMDLLVWSDTPSQNQLWFSNGDGGFTNSASFNITDQHLFKSDGCYTTLLTDIDGDGLPDLLRYKGPTDATGNVYCGSYGPILLYRNTGNGAFTQLPYAGPTLNRVNVNQVVNCNGPGCSPTQATYTAGATFYVTDIDGDGRSDLVTTISPTWTLVFANTPPYGTDPCTSQTCTWVYRGNGDGSFQNTPTNLANVSVYTDNRTNQIGSSRSLVDIDGDGLADLNAVGNFPTKILSYRSRGDGNFDATGGIASCSNSIDFNGDGRSDCLVPGDTAAANALRSTNGGSNHQSVGNFNLTATGQELKGTGIGNLVVDLNGDGRQDILRWKDDPSQNVIYLSNGDGSFTPSSTFNLASVQLQKSDGTRGLLLGDFTGRGAVELLRLQTVNGSASNLLYTKVDPTPPDQLVSVTSGSGLKTTLYYVPLSNATPTNGVSANLGSRYQSDRGNSSYAIPKAVDVTMPMYVVATSVSDSGVDTSQLATEMSYRGLKADLSGRGLLGFRQVLRQRPGAQGSPLTVDTQYLQVHPYIGVASSTSTHQAALNAISAANQLSITTNVYCDQTNAAAASTTAHCPVSAKVVKPYLYWSSESGKDLNGIALPVATTTNTFNDNGDPTQIAITTTGTTAGLAQTFTKITNNTYQPADTACTDEKTCTWVLGRLSQASVTNTVPNSLETIPRSAGNSAQASATQGSGAPPPATPQPPPSISPAVLNAILSILLDD